MLIWDEEMKVCVSIYMGKHIKGKATDTQILHRHELHDKDGLYHRRLVSAEDDN